MHVNFIQTTPPPSQVPFVLGMFVLVEGLQIQGRVDVFASSLGRVTAGSLGGTLWLMGGVSILLSNLINNQPMTILLTEICMDPLYTTLVRVGYKRVCVRVRVRVRACVRACVCVSGAWKGGNGLR